jgi:hypothetical protein
VPAPGDRRFISSVLQGERIEAWRRLYGAGLRQIFDERDESGGRAVRLLLLGAIERVELGVCDRIVVAKLDRSGRSLTDALQHIDRFTSKREGPAAPGARPGRALRHLAARAVAPIQRCGQGAAAGSIASRRRTSTDGV